MPDHLSLFEPYTLTRAFLVVLRAVPLAHAAWLGLVDRGHRLAAGTGIPGLHTLGAPEVRMQTSKVPAEVERLVSVVQTDDDYFRDSDARPWERRQVLDGLLIYGGTFAIARKTSPFEETSGTLSST
jgi:hypothetical protein